MWYASAVNKKRSIKPADVVGKTKANLIHTYFKQ